MFLVKIADFGLSRDLYRSDYYRLTHKAMLPVKWMSPESLFDNIYNQKTDVVSTNDYPTWELLYVFKCYIVHPYFPVVVIWCYMLGDLQSWPHPLPWCIECGAT